MVQLSELGLGGKTLYLGPRNWLRLWELENDTVDAGLAIYRAKRDLREKCIFTNIIDQAIKNNEMKVMGGWENELVKVRIGNDFYKL